MQILCQFPANQGNYTAEYARHEYVFIRDTATVRKRTKKGKISTFSGLWVGLLC